MTTTAAERHSNARWFYIAPSILLFWIVANIDKSSIGFFATNKPFLHQMGLAGRPAEIGLVLSLFIWPYGLATFFWGFAVDRYGPRKTALASIGGWAVAMILGGASYGLGMLAASRVVLGLAEAALWPVSLKLTATWFSRPERGRAKTSYGYGQMAGFLVGTIFVTFLLTVSGWRWAFFILAGLSLIVVLPMFLVLVRDLPSQHHAANEAERRYIGVEGQRLLVGQSVLRDWRGLNRLFRDYRYWLIVYTFIVSSVGSFGLSTWLPSYLEKSRHFSPALMATWTSLAYVAGIVIFLIVSFLGDRTQCFAAIGVVELIVAAACLIGSGLTAQPTVAAPLVAIGFGAVVATVITTPAILHHYAGADVHGRASGVMTGVANIAGGFAPLLIGVFVGAAGGSFAGAFVFLAAVTLLGAVCYAVLIPEEIRRRRKPDVPSARPLEATEA